MRWVLPLALLIAVASPGSAWAGPALRDAPRAFSAEIGPRMTGVLLDSTQLSSDAHRSGWAFFGTELAIGAAVTAITLPMTVAVAARVGLISNGIIGAAVPSLLLLAIVPPLAAALTCWAMANLTATGGFHFWPAFFSALGANIVTLAVAGLLGAAANQPADMIALTAVDAIVIGGATAAALQWTASRPVTPFTLRVEF